MVRIIEIPISHEKIVDSTKSNSQVCGKNLRKAHLELGTLPADELIKKDEFLNVKSVHLYIMMRSGLVFGLAIADRLESKELNVKISFKHDNSPIESNSPFSKVLVVDAVINTGRSIISATQWVQKSNLLIASLVLNQNALSLLDEYSVYAIRISDNSYVGSHSPDIKNGFGPDTGDRLFNSDFYGPNID